MKSPPRAPTSQAKDRKRILRLLIQNITVEKLSDPKQVVLHLRWQGRACEDIPIHLPPRSCDQRRYPPSVVDKVRLLAATLSDADIMTDLNERGQRDDLVAVRMCFAVRSPSGRSVRLSAVEKVCGG